MNGRCPGKEYTWRVMVDFANSEDGLELDVVNTLIKKAGHKATYNSGGMHTQADYVLYWPCNLYEKKKILRRDTVKWS